MSSDRGLRLLALDGGGVRGLVSLLILKRLMHLIDREHPPKPCDIFDFIAGTSTGGLIAIMLGRLKMDVDSCIDAYVSLSREVFNPRMTTRIFGRALQGVIGNAAFDYKALEKAVKRVVGDCLGDENTPLLEKDPKCKVFVCASMSNTETMRLRTYISEVEDHIPCTIWEAGRATSAAPTFFSPITFSNGLTFRDGALRDNNPIFQLLDEVQAQHPRATISTIVSIGTGVPKSLRVNNRLDSVAYACVKISTDTEQVARRFQESYCSLRGPYKDKYFRFNVTRGVAGVRLDEWHKADIMMSNTRSYLREEFGKLKACAKSLTYDRTTRNDEGEDNRGYLAQNSSLQSSGQVPGLLARRSAEDIPDCLVQHLSLLSSSQTSRSSPGNVRSSEVERSIPAYGEIESQGVGSSHALVLHEKQHRSPAEAYSFYQLDRIGLQPVAYFAPRKELDKIQANFDSVSQERTVQILTLVGLGGSGKTQLMLQYASSQREEYGVVLWIDASNYTTMADSFQLAASQLGLRLPPFEAPQSTDTTVTKYKSGIDGDVMLVKRELERRGQLWLLLFDHADDLKVYGSLSKYIPSAPNGRVIVSSRRKDASQIGQQWLEIKVESLDCFALAVDLAGSYIQNLGSLETYLDLYKSQREKLLMRSLGSSTPIVSGYKDSVFTAWGISISAITETAANFLYLLCLLDRSNLSKDLFERACSEKSYWNIYGDWDRLSPGKQGVPKWLLKLFCDDEGSWSDLQFHDAVSRISSFFFVQKEVVSGTWLHRSGSIETESLTADGKPITLLNIPRPVHELGRYYLNRKKRRQFCYDAFSIILQSFKYQVPTRQLPPLSKPLMYTGRGGMVDNPRDLQRQLEEAYNHILVLKDDIRYVKSGPPRCFDTSVPLWERCEALMFAGMYWSDLLELYKMDIKDSEVWHHGGPRSRGKRETKWEGEDESEESEELNLLVQTPWQTILEWTESIIRKPPRVTRGWTPRTSGSWNVNLGSGDFEFTPKGPSVTIVQDQSNGESDLPIPHSAFRDIEHDFETKWSLRNRYYHEKLAQTRGFTQGRFVRLNMSAYRIAAFAECELNSGHIFEDILDQIHDWLRRETEGGLSFDEWVSSDIGEYFAWRARNATSFSRTAPFSISNRLRDASYAHTR
ncbi:hypothetical protein B7463_g6711, partial [Scytalidium lignicola]